MLLLTTEVPPTTPAERLARAVLSARRRRWRRRSDFARACGLSVRTILAIESGQPKHYRRATLAAVESALGWAPGDAERVMDGGDPTLDPELQHVVNSWPRLSPQVRAIVVGIVDDALAH